MDEAETITVYCSGCDEPTTLPRKIIADLPPDRCLIWDCRPCGHRNRMELPAASLDADGSEPPSQR